MKRWLIMAAAMAAVVVLIGWQQYRIAGLTKERDRGRANVETLLSDVEKYRTRDSLNAATIGALELTVQEYERFRAADAEMIKTLRTRNRDLQAVTKAQTETIMELSTVPRDTVIIRDSIPIPAVAVHAGDAWYDFDGLLTEKEFAGTLAVRDSLLIAETVQYKRFLGFLWKTKRVKNRKIDIICRNPYTTIVDCEFVTIEK